MPVYREGEEVEIEFAPEWQNLVTVRFYQTPPTPGPNFVRHPAYVFQTRDPQELLAIVLALRQALLDMTGIGDLDR